MYIRNDTGQIVSSDCYRSTIMLVKTLFFLSIINEKQVIDLAKRFDIIFV